MKNIKNFTVSAFLAWLFGVATVVLSVVNINGCAQLADTVKVIRDADFTKGCKVIDTGVGFNSYFQTTQGRVASCGLKCSDTLNPNYHFKYENQNTGCFAEIKTDENGDIIK